MIRDIKTNTQIIEDVCVEIKVKTNYTHFKNQRHCITDKDWAKIPVNKVYNGSLEKLHPFMQNLADDIFNLSSARVKVFRWNYKNHTQGYFFSPE